MNRAALRRLVLSPAVSMTSSVLLVALSGYLFLALAGRLTVSRDAAAMASMYVLVNTLGQGVFVGLEQETSRSLSHTLAVGGAPAPVVRRAVRHTAGLLALCFVFLAAASPLLVSGPLHGEWILIGSVFVGTTSAALSYLVRGLLGGAQLFGGYSASLVAEGMSRLLPCVAIVALGAGSALVYCLVFACGLFFSAAAGAWWLRPLLAEVRAERRSRVDLAAAVDQTPVTGDATAVVAATGDGRRRLASAGLLLLVGASLLTQLVANLPALGASSRLSAAPATAASFVQAATLSRIPLLLTGPVTALLLPRLTSAGAVGDLGAVRRTVRTGAAAMLLLGGLAASGLAVLGPWVLHTFFNASGVSALSLVTMGVGTAGLMTVSVLQPALVGVRRQRLVPAAWGVGAVAMTVAVVWPGDPVRAAVAASLVGPIAVAAAMALGLRGLRPEPAGDDVADADRGPGPVTARDAGADQASATFSATGAASATGR